MSYCHVSKAEIIAVRNEDITAANSMINAAEGPSLCSAEFGINTKGDGITNNGNFRLSDDDNGCRCPFQNCCCVTADILASAVDDDSWYYCSSNFISSS
jgi:hypothetical protein